MGEVIPNVIPCAFLPIVIRIDPANVNKLPIFACEYTNVVYG